MFSASYLWYFCFQQNHHKKKKKAYASVRKIAKALQKMMLFLHIRNAWKFRLLNLCLKFVTVLHFGNAFKHNDATWITERTY